MQQETFIVGNREFTCVRMNPFAANKLLMRIQRVVLPVLGDLAKGGRGMLDLDVKEAAITLSQHLDETLVDTVVLPMFAESKLYAVQEKRFVKDEMGINLVFTTENLMELYELVWLVGRYQFAPFFASLLGRFGTVLAAAPATQSSLESSTTK